MEPPGATWSATKVKLEKHLEKKIGETGRIWLNPFLLKYYQQINDFFEW